MYVYMYMYMYMYTYRYVPRMLLRAAALPSMTLPDLTCLPAAHSRR